MAMTTQPALEGIIPILSMPFRDDDAVDLDALVAQAVWLAETGVDGVGFGFGSEIFRLSERERDEAVTQVAQALDGRLPIVVATSANSTHAAVQRAEAAKGAGGTILMITPPAYVTTTPDDLIAHYATIAERMGLPIIVQDAPGMTGVTMAPELLARIAREIDLVAAVKVESVPPAPKVGAVAAIIGDAATVLGGAGGSDFMHELMRGARGTIPGAAMPELFVAVWRLFDAGKVAEARCLFNRYLPLFALTGRTMDLFLYTQKELLRRRGILPSARMRLPAERIDPDYTRELDAMVSDLGLDELCRQWEV